MNSSRSEAKNDSKNDLLNDKVSSTNLELSEELSTEIEALITDSKKSLKKSNWLLTNGNDQEDEYEDLD